MQIKFETADQLDGWAASGTARQPTDPGVNPPPPDPRPLSGGGLVDPPTGRRWVG